MLFIIVWQVVLLQLLQAFMTDVSNKKTHELHANK